MPLPTSRRSSAINPTIALQGPIDTSSTANAFERLQSAFKAGVVTSQDLLDIGLVKPAQRRAAVAEARSAEQDALAKEEIRPLQRQQLMEDIEFKRRDRSRKEAIDEIELTKVKEEEQTRVALKPFEAELKQLDMENSLAVAKIIKADPTGARAHAIKMYLNATGASQLPRDPQNGEIDWKAIDADNKAYLKQQQMLEKLKGIKSQTVTKQAPDGSKSSEVVQYAETLDGPQVVGKPLPLGTTEQSPASLPADPKVVTDLRKEYANRPEIRELRVVNAAYEKLLSTTTNPNPSAADDISAIFSYMRILDPGSTVREGEFATAQSATGVPGRVVNLYNQLLKGNRLNPEQRADYAAAAAGLYKAQLKSVRPTITQFKTLSEKANIPVDDIVPPEDFQALESISKPSVAVPAASPEIHVDAKGNHAIKNADGSWTPVIKDPSGKWVPVQ